VQVKDVGLEGADLAQEVDRRACVGGLLFAPAVEVVPGLALPMPSLALTIGFACVPETELARAADLAIVVDAGPEFISGSTRMKAGTAQKLVLNTISTVTMVKLGKTFGELMVDVAPSNEKLRARARTAVALATAAPDDDVSAAMAAAEGDAKVAIVSLLAGVDAETARSRLSAARGVIREAVGDVVG
jgi:N-acetylmuramic acid 6-phosphate etherase